tara:strand:- start:1 stop:1125 length:1125 start_codon:yes stop_codon:yes gene_type:complete
MAETIDDNFYEIDDEQERLSFLLANVNSNDREIVEFCYDKLSEIQISDADLDENSVSMLNQIIEDGLNHNNDLVRRWCCFFVGRNQVKSQIDKMISMAEQDINMSVRYNAIGALGDLFAVKAIPNLIELLSSIDTFNHGRNAVSAKEVSLSEQAFIALSKLGFDEYLPQIVEYYERAEGEVKIRLIPTLANYPTPEIRELIREELFNENSARDGNMLIGYKSIIPVAIKALVKLEDDDSVSIIAKLSLEHEDWQVRKAAVLSLVSSLEQGHRYPLSDEGFSFDTIRNCPEAIECLFELVQKKDISDNEMMDMSIEARFGVFPPQIRVMQFLDFMMHPDRIRIDEEELEKIISQLNVLREYWINFTNELIQNEEE